MKILSRMAAVGLILTISACQPAEGNQESAYATEQAELFDSLMETAIFETSVAKQLTAQVPTSTYTAVPPTDTLVPSITPTPEPTTVRNPWLLQEECEPFNNEVCVRYSVITVYRYPKGFPPASIHVTLTHVETGDEGVFVIGSGAIGTILLLRGTYHAVYSGECDGEWASYYNTWAINDRTDQFTCIGETLKFLGVKTGP